VIGVVDEGPQFARKPIKVESDDEAHPKEARVKHDELRKLFLVRLPENEARFEDRPRALKEQKNKELQLWS
jgi:folate-dependent phosphoribosylglycinamide formyltransferase PurN